MIASVGRGTLANTSTQGINYSVHPAAIPGDFACMVYGLRSATVTVNTPSGWTNYFTDVVNSNRLLVFGKFTTGFGSDNGGTEPATQFQNSTGASLPYWACGWTVRGVDTASPFLVTPGVSGGAGTTGTDITAPSLTPPDSGGLAMWFWLTYLAAAANTSTMTVAAGLGISGVQVRTAQTVGYNGIMGGTLMQPYNAASGAKVSTCSASGSWRGIGMVLRESRVRQPEHHHVLAAA